MFRFVSLCLVAVSVVGFSEIATAGVGFRQLTSTFPVAVRRGTVATVQVRSNFTLDNTHTALFYKPGTTSGIQMTLAETAPIAATSEGDYSTGTPFRFRVQVPADQEPGVYEYRLATNRGVSSVAHLLVTEYPVIEEKDGENETAATAQPVSVPAAICGVCEEFEDRDYYRFTGEAGQELTIQIYAQRVTEGIHDMAVRIGTHLMDPILTLIGPEGRVVAENNHFFGGDSLLFCKLPTSGEYVLEVRDYRYAGNPRYTYCVELSDRPFAHAVFPMAVERGTSTQVEVLGNALKGTEKSHIHSNAEEELGWKTLRLETPNGPTNPVPVLVSPYPNLVAANGNRSIATASPIALPVGIDGRFSEPDEAHYFAFDAAAGKFYRFALESPRRGLPLDSVIEIFNDAGELLAEADDGFQTKDARLLFKAPSDGRYYLAVKDLHGRSGPRFLYHLRAEPTGPDFEVRGEYDYAMLAPGTSTIWFARVERLAGFEGPVEMNIEGLPDGVRVTPVTLAKGMDQCGLILTASPDAKLGASLARVRGKARIAGADGTLEEVVRYGHVTCEQRRAGASLLARWPIHTQVVGLTDPLDILKVNVTPTELTLKPGEKAEIKVRVKRSEAYNELIMLDTAFRFGRRTFGEQLPPGVSMAKSSKVRLTSDMVEGTIVLEASADALPVERLPFAALARVPVTYSIMTNYASSPIFLTIPASPTGSAE